MADARLSQPYPALGPGDRWVTINGNHVLIRRSEGEEPQAQAQASPSPSWPCMADQTDWEKSADQLRISDSLGTVHDLGLIVFGETQSYTNRPDSNEPIDVAREKMAHTIINADRKWGFKRQVYASTHGAIEPPDRALQNRDVCAAYQSSMKAAREAWLSGDDPTHGAIFAIANATPDRSNHVFKGRYAKAEGVPISTQSGPYNNSYTGRDMHSHEGWLNTYYDK